mmetsp:Transcript_16006/g.45442  ORF Transcript_16006/g.45442 Transcript_16006/m.45442 type:complete len:209 (-) Transcript_16006:1859-2485(-)
MPTNKLRLFFRSLSGAHAPPRHVGASGAPYSMSIIDSLGPSSGMPSSRMTRRPAERPTSRPDAVVASTAGAKRSVDPSSSLRISSRDQMPSLDTRGAGSCDEQACTFGKNKRTRPPGATVRTKLKLKFSATTTPTASDGSRTSCALSKAFILGPPSANGVLATSTSSFASNRDASNCFREAAVMSTGAAKPSTVTRYPCGLGTNGASA